MRRCRASSRRMVSYTARVSGWVVDSWDTVAVPPLNASAMHPTRSTSSLARCSAVNPRGRIAKRPMSTTRGAAPPSSIATRLASSTCEHSSARKSLVIPSRSSGAFTSTIARSTSVNEATARYSLMATSVHEARA